MIGLICHEKKRCSNVLHVTEMFYTTVLYQVYGGGVYLKNSSALETGITGSCTVGGGSTFAIGCKYALDKDAAVRAKVDTNSQVNNSNKDNLCQNDECK